MVSITVYNIISIATLLHHRIRDSQVPDRGQDRSQLGDLEQWASRAGQWVPELNVPSSERLPS